MLNVVERGVVGKCHRNNVTDVPLRQGGSFLLFFTGHTSLRIFLRELVHSFRATVDLILSFKDFDLNYFSGTHMSCINPNFSIVL